MDRRFGGLQGQFGQYVNSGEFGSSYHFKWSELFLKSV
jgi:hypothetical protein